MTLQTSCGAERVNHISVVVVVVVVVVFNAFWCDYDTDSIIVKVIIFVVYLFL